MTVTYSSLIAEAKSLLASCASEIEALVGISLPPRASGSGIISTRLSHEVLRAGVRLSNRLAIISGLIAHTRLRCLAASLRAAFLEAANGEVDGLEEDIREASSLIRQSAQALELLPGYGEMLRPSGRVLRPPISREVSVQDICSRLAGESRVRLVPFDGRFLGENKEGIFRLSVQKKRADDSRAEGKWLSLVYFDAGSMGENGPLGLAETANALVSLIARGELLRYGGISMSYAALNGLNAILPCYGIVLTREDPSIALASRLPASRLLKIISSPDKAFLPEPGAGGPEAKAFSLYATEEDEDYLAINEEAPSAVPEPTQKIQAPKQATPSELVSPPQQEVRTHNPPTVAEAKQKAMPQAARPDPNALDSELPAGIVFPEMHETEDEGFHIDDFRIEDIQGEAKAGGSGAKIEAERENGSDEMAALLGSTAEDHDYRTQEGSEAHSAHDDYSQASSFSAPGVDYSHEADHRESKTRGSVKEARIEITHDMRIRLPISVKMMSIISLLILVALGTMIALASYFFRQEIRNQVAEASLQISQVIRQKFEYDFIAVSDKAYRLIQGYISRSRGLDQNALTALKAELYQGENEVLFAAAYPEGGGEAIAELANINALADFRMDEKTIMTAIAGRRKEIEAAVRGDALCMNISVLFREPCVLAAWSYQVEGQAGALVVIFNSRERLQESVEAQKKSIRQQQLISLEGEIIAHPDSNVVIQAQDVSNLDFFKDLQKSQANIGQFRYRDESGLYYSATYSKLQGIGAWVLSAVEEKRAFEAVANVQRNNILLAIMVIAAAILLVYFYSKSLVVPIRALVGAARRIEAGQFELSLRARAHDELGLLTETFVNMGHGLAERERLKDTFGKFVNKEIAEQAQRGTLKLGGERKHATIFFSDIRGFTSISERLEPEEVVDFLNKYMTRMVKCVNATGGVVDKYIGDAIMAVWGVPPIEGVSDAESAVNAALMMRKELIEFNLDRGGPRSPIIRIGCGLNSGPVIAGQIGSNERMEYTVIGDSVNLASRIEALNKPFGTDILVSQDTYTLVKSVFRMEKMKPIVVKGKSEPQSIYAVLGRIDDPYCPRNLAEIQSLLGLEHKDLSKVNVDEEEVKYKIADEGAAH